jgi:hypothetical protein
MNEERNEEQKCPLARSYECECKHELKKNERKNCKIIKVPLKDSAGVNLPFCQMLVMVLVLVLGTLPTLLSNNKNADGPLISLSLSLCFSCWHTSPS